MDGFQLLPVSFCSGEGGEGHTSAHGIFCKKHGVRQNVQATPNKRTLFTLGWPPYATCEAIEELFSRAGHVTAVYLQASPGPVDSTRNNDAPNGFKVGYVVFSTESDADAALHLCHSPTPISCSTPTMGLCKWAHDYLLRRPSVTLLEKAAEVGVALYDQQQEESLQAKERAGQPDEEGWITVTRKTPRIVGDEYKRRQKKKKQKEFGMNVYPWQQRESQREQVADLRRKFEEDKQRVAKMKEQRRFKPY